MTDPIGTDTASATSAEAVARWLLPQDATDQAITDAAPRYADVAASVNVLVARWKGGPPAEGWGADVRQGATMLASRLYRRRNSPGGVEVFGAEGATYVSRNDPDVAMLLSIGAYTPPVVG